jgi:hypothetical protein
MRLLAEHFLDALALGHSDLGFCELKVRYRFEGRAKLPGR